MSLLFQPRVALVLSPRFPSHLLYVERFRRLNPSLMSDIMVFCSQATVPIGYYGEGSGKVGQPYGLAFVARRFGERKLIRVMAAFEQNFPARRVPSQLE